MQIENEITHFNLVLLQLLLFDGHIISKCTKSTQNIVSFLSHADSNWEAPVIMIKFILIQCNHSLYQMDKIHHILGWERVEWMQKWKRIIAPHKTIESHPFVNTMGFSLMIPFNILL
eukprot:203921_1